MKSIEERLLLAVTPIWLLAIIGKIVLGAQEVDDGQSLSGRIVAVGIPGASAVSAVGTFLRGGPLHDKPALAAFTQPGRVLDPARILVGSTSNFGGPLADEEQFPGSFLSIDPQGVDIIVVPPDFAI